ncbi:MAG: DUF3006 domain-containing protein [Clostridia bacterium]|nr:DUF3006 domain-containing protein [Clostridia bacterium]
MRIIVDRIEGEYAVCELEDGSMKDIALSELPSETEEGSVLIFTDGEYINDFKTQEELKTEILALQNSIFDE